MYIRSTYFSRMNFLTNQTTALGGALAEVNQTIATGRSVSNPSDAPELMERIHQIRDAITRQSRFSENAGMAQNVLSAADSTMSELAGVLTQALTLGVQMSSEGYQGEVRIASAVEAEALLNEAMALVNTSVGGQALFAGNATDQNAYADDGTYQGSDTEASVAVGENSTAVVGFSGEDLGLGEVLSAISSLQNALEADDTASVQASLDELNAAVNTIATAHTQVGAEQGTAIDFGLFADNMQLELTSQLSSLEDADMVEALTRLAELQTSYEAAISMTAHTGSVSLFNMI